MPVVRRWFFLMEFMRVWNLCWQNITELAKLFLVLSAIYLRCLHQHQHHHRLRLRLRLRLLLPRRSGIILSSKSIKRRCRLFFSVFFFLRSICFCMHVSGLHYEPSLARENIWDWPTLIAVRGKVVQLNAASFDSRILTFQP